MSGYISYKFCEYLGTEIPTHWNDKKLGYLSNQTRNAFVDGPFGSDLKSTDYQDDGIPLIQLNNIRDSTHVIRNMKFVSEIKKKELIRHIAYPGDIVFAKMAEPVARATIVSGFYNEYIIVADCIKMEPNEKISNPDYLIWAINCDEVRINAELVSTGTTRIRINLSELKKLKIPFPPIPEQTQIAAFLDHETAKIDTLIDKQQQLIELLKEKRQAVISHAVTKGLDPDVPMKDSGVDWLGEVPEHWIVSRIGYYASKIGSGKTPKGGAEIYQSSGILFLRSQNIYDDGFRISDSDNAYISEVIHEEMNNTKVKVGDVLLNITGGSIGRSCIVTNELIEANVNQHVCILRFADLYREFISLFMKSKSFKKQIDIFQTGGNREGLNFWQISKFIFCVPIYSEINAIVEFIKGKIILFNELEEKSILAIELLKERRTALISAAVTGKIDVRDWQVPVTQTESDEVMA